MRSQTIRVDVREDIRAGREPFSRIMAAAARVDVRGSLVVTAPFEPAPLYSVLEARGFLHSAKELPGGDWEIRFTRRETAPLDMGGKVITLDARGLEPPHPMVKILEALAGLTADVALHARTDRRPLHLLPQLEARGFCAECSEQPDGGFLTVIRHV